jgi:predicted SAM-dependent methyltransferase
MSIDDLKGMLPRGLRSDSSRALSMSKRVVQQAVTALMPRQDLTKVEGEHLLLHIGCGERLMPGWINVDISDAPGTYFADLRNPLPLAAGRVAHIHCEHVVEHLEYDDAQSFFRECHRVLEPGGSLRVIVPDAGKYLRAYAAGDDAFFAQLVRLGNAQNELRTKAEIINQMFRMGGDHRFAWDFETMALVLREAGFVRIAESSLGDVPPDRNIDGTDSWRPHESLYVNAFKKSG